MLLCKKADFTLPVGSGGENVDVVDIKAPAELVMLSLSLVLLLQKEQLLTLPFCLCL